MLHSFSLRSLQNMTYKYYRILHRLKGLHGYILIICILKLCTASALSFSKYHKDKAHFELIAKKNGSFCV